MKENNDSRSTHWLPVRDVILIAGIASITFGVGLVTPLVDSAFAWSQLADLWHLKTLFGLLLAMAPVVLFLLFWRNRSQHRVKQRERLQSDFELASFTTLDPYPILEVSAQGEVLYANPAAIALFPDLLEQGTAHPIFHNLGTFVAGLRDGSQQHLIREIKVGRAVFEQQVSRVPGSDHVCFYLVDITTRKHAQDALCKSEEKFSRVFRSAPMAISVSKLSDGRFVDVNDSFVQLLGYGNRKEIINQTATDLGMWVYHGERAYLLEKLAQNDHVVHRHEAQIHHRSGEVRDVIVSVVVLDVGGETCILSTLLDVTERREAEAGLEVLKAFYENTLKELPIEVAVLDAQARFFYLNPEAVSNEEMRLWMVGKTSVDYALVKGLDPAPYQRRHEWLLDVIRQRSIGQLEETLQSATGSVYHMLRVATPVLDDDGEVIYVVGYGMDITDRKAFEHQLLTANNAAEEMARLKSAFVANMSHEVRTPLTAILGFAKVLGEELEGEHQELADLIKQSGDRLLETLNSVLDLARLEADAIEADMQPLELIDEVLSASRLYRPIAEKKGLVFILELPRRPLRVRLDRPFLHRILNNLLTNAIKFTDHGEIRLSVRHLDDEVQIQVHDTGIGIGEAFRPHLFEEFKQESTGLARTHTGSGLGLSITQHLVERMNGRIDVQSAKGVGTLFTVTFPATDAFRDDEAFNSTLRDQLSLFSGANVVNT